MLFNLEVYSASFRRLLSVTINLNTRAPELERLYYTVQAVRLPYVATVTGKEQLPVRY